MKRQLRQPGLMIVLTVIGLISTYDAYLVFAYRETVNEQNPICNWLIQLEPKFVSFFLAGKGLATLAVLVTLYAICQKFARIGQLATAVVLAFQIGLMGYLHTAEIPGLQPSVVAQRRADYERQLEILLARKAEQAIEAARQNNVSP